MGCITPSSVGGSVDDDDGAGNAATDPKLIDSAQIDTSRDVMAESQVQMIKCLVSRKFKTKGLKSD